MKTIIVSLFTVIFMSNLFGQTIIPESNIQIATAVLASPIDQRDGAMVYGFDSDGKFTILKKGTNEMVCIGDDPAKKDISVACYHKSLEPFMIRGRQLQKEGKSPKEIFDMRENEVKAGTLKMPAEPTTLYAYTGSQDNYDPKTGTLKNGYLRYVVYIPYATAETSGLPLKPDMPGMPWLMDPGTHRAHIMINPAKN